MTKKGDEIQRKRKLTRERVERRTNMKWKRRQKELKKNKKEIKENKKMIIRRKHIKLEFYQLESDN